MDCLRRRAKVSTGGAIGGESQEETDLHFAHRFDGSCARVELAVLDPKSELQDLSDHFIRAFSGGRIRLLDIPCGCGAASAALLSTIAELRHRNAIPREPLEVFLTGGDISDPARRYVELVFGELEQTLRNQGIFVRVSLPQWDIRDAASTTVLLDRWLTDAPDCKSSFLLIANFSGFLGIEKHLEEVEERIGEVFRWARARDSAAVWLEPPMKKNKRGRFRVWLKETLSKLTGWLRNPVGPSVQLTTEATFVQPIRESHIPVRLLLLHLESPSR